LSVGVADRTEAHASVDPRIAARRRSVEVERRRRRRRRLLALALVVTVVAAGWLATRTALLDVDAIEVDGAQRVAPADVVAASGVRPGDPLVGVDTSAAAARVEELAWVRTAQVGRGIDGRVTVTVTERTPVATLATDLVGGAVLVDDTGRVLGPVDGAPDELVELAGVEPVAAGGTIDGAAEALSVVLALGPGARSRVQVVGRSPDGDVVLGLRPQGRVVVGPPTELERKAGALTTLLGQVDQRNLGVIDARDPDNLQVTRTPP